MKVEPSPTSPKLEHSRTEPPTRRMMIVLVLVAGVLGGVADIALHRLAFQFPESQFLKMFVTAPAPTQEVVLVRTEEEEANEQMLRSLQQNVLPRTVAIFESPSTLQTGALTVLSKERFRGAALFVTADGLVMTTKTVLAPESGPYIAVTHDRRVLSVSAIFEDPASQFVFARIEGNDFSVSEFEGLSDGIPGEMLYIIMHHGFSSEAAMVSSRLVTSHVFDARDTESALHSSDAFDRTALLDIRFQSEFEGAGVLNADGKVVGVVRGDGERTLVVPTEQVTGVFEEAISKQRIARPLLGVHYLDLSEPIVIGAAEARDRGALLFGTPSIPAVTSGSAASRAGLQEGDILLTVNGSPLSARVSVQDALLDNQPGTQANILFVRAGEEREVVVTLDAHAP